MATTSLWRVHGWLGKVVIYIENPDKTGNPKFFEKPEMTEHQVQGLSDVIDYAVNTLKTAGRTDDESNVITQQFVSGVNISPLTARDSMMRTKREFKKTGGVIAYHGYQSFAPGEATPETAHEIGKKLAERLWGDRYQVLIATHLDKSNHLHNHFVLNTVSFVDGKKYYRSEKDYYNMQKESDALCREYGLSVIEEPRRGKSRHYVEWQAEKNGRSTYRGEVKADFDRALRESMTERQLWENLYQKGYRIKFGEDITLRPPGKDRGLKLHRNFGEDYTGESIRRRILAQTRPERQIIPADPPPKKMRFTGTFHKARRMTGLRALYFYYLYRMGVLPKKRKPNPKQVYFLFREDIRFVQNISRETRLLVKHGIDTADRLAAHKEGLNTRIHSLCIQRKTLRNKLRRVRDGDGAEPIKIEIAALSEQIKELRREVRLCEDIETRSGVMRDKIRRAREETKSREKELKKDEPFRRRR